MAEKSWSAAMRTDPSPFARRIGLRVMAVLVGPRRARRRHRLAEWRRHLTGAPRRIAYFHQVDDPYSHLAAQVLERLADAYDVEIIPHLVGPASKQEIPEPELLAAYARKDAADVAPAYGLRFPRDVTAPAGEPVILACRILAAASPVDFGARAVAVGEALWAGDKDGLERLAAEHGAASEGVARARVAGGAARRRKLGHYSGAMFCYDSEWYWGVDRLYHLEACLTRLGARRPGAELVAPRPVLDPRTERDDAGRITLEFFPSLRSPYTAIVYDRTLALAERTGVRLVLRPVMPMVMRGAPVPFAKAKYIFADTLREAESEGVAFGKAVDPIGRPVERGFSLFPWAREQGRAGAFLGEFLRGAWAERVDTSTDAGLRHVVEAAGLSWGEAQAVLDNDDWREELEANRVTMYQELGLWGVPAYRIRGPAGRADFATWGQDRLWLVAQELRERIAAD